MFENHGTSTFGARLFFAQGGLGTVKHEAKIVCAERPPVGMLEWWDLLELT